MGKYSLDFFFFNSNSTHKCAEILPQPENSTEQAEFCGNKFWNHWYASPAYFYLKVKAVASEVAWIFLLNIFMKLSHSQRQWFPTWRLWRTLTLFTVLNLTLQRQVFLQASRKKTPMTLFAALDSSNVAGRFGDHCAVDLSTKCGGIYVFYHRPRTPNDNPCQHNRMTLPFLNAGQIFNTAWNYFQNFRECCRHQHKALSISVKLGRHTPSLPSV